MRWSADMIEMAYVEASDIIHGTRPHRLEQTVKQERRLISEK